VTPLQKVTMMSQDASVVVLQTLDGYRVAMVFAAINLYIWHQHAWKVNKEMLRMTFAGVAKYEDYEKAIEAANKIYDEHEYIEYGICVMREFFQTDFDYLINDQPLLKED